MNETGIYTRVLLDTNPFRIMIMLMKQCKKCGWQWKPKVKNPVECPNCKSRKWKTNPRVRS